ncbi:MAG TPA: polysaccharide deacetylase family protein, partial [bacterium]
MKNIMTFDIEEWYHSNLDGNDPRLWDRYESRVVDPTLRLVQHLNETGNSATFFILGKVAERFPEMVKAIQENGHEIASHSY